ncbi:MAG: hypothetical protein ACRDSN_03170 [Pseudonocardiaceae bacterium]
MSAKIPPSSTKKATLTAAVPTLKPVLRKNGAVKPGRAFAMDDQRAFRAKSGRRLLGTNTGRQQRFSARPGGSWDSPRTRWPALERGCCLWSGGGACGALACCGELVVGQADEVCGVAAVVGDFHECALVVGLDDGAR